MSTFYEAVRAELSELRDAPEIILIEDLIKQATRQSFEEAVAQGPEEDAAKNLRLTDYADRLVRGAAAAVLNSPEALALAKTVVGFDGFASRKALDAYVEKATKAAAEALGGALKEAKEPVTVEASNRLKALVEDCVAATSAATGTAKASARAAAAALFATPEAIRAAELSVRRHHRHWQDPKDAMFNLVEEAIKAASYSLSVPYETKGLAFEDLVSIVAQKLELLGDNACNLAHEALGGYFGKMLEVVAEMQGMVEASPPVEAADRYKALIEECVCIGAGDRGARQSSFLIPKERMDVARSAAASEFASPRAIKDAVQFVRCWVEQDPEVVLEGLAGRAVQAASAAAAADGESTAADDESTAADDESTAAAAAAAAFKERIFSVARGLKLAGDSAAKRGIENLEMRWWGNSTPELNWTAKEAGKAAAVDVFASPEFVEFIEKETRGMQRGAKPWGMQRGVRLFGGGLAEKAAQAAQDAFKAVVLAAEAVHETA